MTKLVKKRIEENSVDGILDLDEQSNVNLEEEGFFDSNLDIDEPFEEYAIEDIEKPQENSKEIIKQESTFAEQLRKINLRNSEIIDLIRINCLDAAKKLNATQVNMTLDLDEIEWQEIKDYIINTVETLGLTFITDVVEKSQIAVIIAW